MESALAFALAVIGAVVAAEHLRTTQVPRSYYQPYFGAAVLQACGHGFHDASAPDSPALGAFLSRERDSISCDELGALEIRPPTPFQRVHWHLMHAVGLLWSVFGVSWSVVTPLIVSLFALTTVATFALLRLGARRAVAGLLTLAFMLSVNQLRILHYLRDYGKAPFFVVLLVCLAAITCCDRSRWERLALAAGAGVAVGVGVGFRRDLLIGAPFALGTFLGFMSGASWRSRLSACAAFLIMMIATGWPVLTILAEGVNSWHVIILGLMTSFDEVLGIERTFYDLGYLWNDSYVLTLVNGYAWRTGLSTHDLGLATGAYDTASRAFFLEAQRTFPGDAVARAFAAVLGALDSTATPRVFSMSRSTWLAAAIAVRNILLGPLGLPFAGVGVTAAALIVLIAKTPRYGTFALFCTLYFAGYSSLVFQGRHFFHVEVIPLWAVGFLIERMLRLCARWRREGLRSALKSGLGSGRAARGVAAAIVVPLVAAAFVQAARWVQADRVRALVARLEHAPLEPLVWAVRPARSGRTNLALNPKVEPAVSEERRFGVAYLVLTFGGSRCQQESAEVRFRYRKESPPEFSWSHVVPLSARGETRVLTAVYEVYGVTRFTGLNMPSEAAPCLTGVYRVRSVAGLTLLPRLTLTPDWERGPLHQGVSWLEVAR